VWGGTDPKTGLDCSGLVQRAYADLGVKLPRVAADQARQGTPVASLSQAKPGDLVAFGSPVDHIGIYAGDNKMVVAPKRGDVVKIQEITRTPTAIRRILPDTAPGPMSISGTNPLAGFIGLIPSVAPAASAGAASGGGASAYDSLFQTAGAKYGVSPDLLSAVARAESGYNPAAKSSAGALGLMQIMPQTAKGLGVDPMDPAQAVDGAARILSGNLQKFNGSVALAVAAYNAGAGAVSRYNGIPPFTETQNYVRRVLSYAGVAS
jgi:soluble lytic murein transglycosylase-like protein